jgi:hypothetical protein
MIQCTTESLLKHLHSISAHELGQVLTEAALSKVFMWVEMLEWRFFLFLKGFMMAKGGSRHGISFFGFGRDDA